MWENIDIIVLRLFLAMLFSGLIGYEREVSESNAGLKTHILVALSATIIALLQMEVIGYVRDLALASPDGPINVSSDATRLIAQVVSGIGFLGAGSIIVTKRNVSGLTTAASIWSVASIGIALGMGFYPLATAGFIFVIVSLFLFKRVFKLSSNQRIIVKYIGGSVTLNDIKIIFSEIAKEFELISFKSEVFHDYIISENTFKIDDLDVDYQELVSKLSDTKNVVSVERTNLY